MKCRVCGKDYKDLSSFLGVCRECIRKRWKKAKEFVDKAFTTRKELGLPTFPTRERDGVECKDCGNKCRIGKNKKGYCGLVINENGKLKRILGTKEKGLFHYYYDPHPTNCTASFWCGSTGIGYPRYSVMPRREIGYLNLSVFSGSCNYFCLYCQNTSWHKMVKSGTPTISVEELVNATNEKTTCACFFGGSASVQPDFVFSFMKLVRKRKEELNLRVFRICFEDSGNFSWYWLKKIAKLSLESGGGIKFDLKTAPGSKLNLALSGVSNKQAYKNFKRLVDLHQKRPEVPFLRVSTLLVPHYIDLKEVEEIAKFIASLDRSIPYSLLAFYPHYRFSDVGFTNRSFALKCLEVCRKVGLKNARIGNVHLLVG